MKVAAPVRPWFTNLPAADACRNLYPISHSLRSFNSRPFSRFACNSTLKFKQFLLLFLLLYYYYFYYYIVIFTIIILIIIIFIIILFLFKI